MLPCRSTPVHRANCPGTTQDKELTESGRGLLVVGRVTELVGLGEPPLGSWHSSSLSSHRTSMGWNKVLRHLFPVTGEKSLSRSPASALSKITVTVPPQEEAGKIPGDTAAGGWYLLYFGSGVKEVHHGI